MSYEEAASDNGEQDRGHWHLPPEWIAHDGCWIAWPVHQQTFGSALPAARNAYAQVANTIAESEPVTMIIHPREEKEAKKLLSCSVERIFWPYDDSWLRDTAPTFVMDDRGNPSGIDWGFNDYGDKDGRGAEGYEADAKIARRMLKHLGIPRIQGPFILEGGAIQTDGEGTLITTESVVLNPNRNPELSKTIAEKAFFELLGISKVIWLRHGLAGDDTDGHVDNIATFAAPETVLVLSETNPKDVNFSALSHIRAQLAASEDALGRRLHVIEVPQPKVREWNGKRLTLSYLNYYLTADLVVMPSFGDARLDADARAILNDAFPSRTVISLEAIDLAVGGGGIHCITHEVFKI